MSQTVRVGANGLVYSKCVEANLNDCGSLIVAIVSDSDSFICNIRPICWCGWYCMLCH